MNYEIIKPIPLSEQQESFVLAGHAAFESYEDIYSEFALAFPEAMNVFFEDHSNAYQQMLEESIRRLHPSNAHFDHERLGPTFTALRRNYLNNQEDEYFGQSRNRLKVAQDSYNRILIEMEQNPEKFVDCQRLIIDLLKETRAETTAFAVPALPGRNEVSSEEMARMIAQLDNEQLEEFTDAKKRGEDPHSVLTRIKAATSANVDQVQEALPEAEDTRQEPEEDFNEVESPAIIPSEGTVEQDEVPADDDTTEYPENTTSGDITPD